MTRLEWWHDVSPGFVAVPELLQETFATGVANYETTVHPPSIPADDVTARSGFPAPPRIGGRRPAMAEDCWGDIHHGTRANPVGVVVQQLAFSTETPTTGISRTPLSQSLRRWTHGGSTSAHGWRSSQDST
jgi:hypothetical protein